MKSSNFWANLEKERANKRSNYSTSRSTTRTANSNFPTLQSQCSSRRDFKKSENPFGLVCTANDSFKLNWNSNSPLMNNFTSSNNDKSLLASRNGFRTQRERTSSRNNLRENMKTSVSDRQKEYIIPRNLLSDQNKFREKKLNFIVKSKETYFDTKSRTNDYNNDFSQRALSLNDVGDDINKLLNEEEQSLTARNHKYLYEKQKRKSMESVALKKIILKEVALKTENRKLKIELDYKESDTNNYFAGDTSRQTTMNKTNKTFANLQEKLTKRISFNQEKTETEKKDLFLTSEKLKNNFKVYTYLNPPERSNIIKSLEREIQKRIFIPKMKNPYIIKKNLLIVLNLFLTECKGPCSLKYCYLEMPFSVESKKEKLIKDEFEEVKSNLIERFNLNSNDLFFFLKNGIQIHHHYELPQEEITLIMSETVNFNQLILLHLGTNHNFKGIYRISKEKKVLYELFKTIKILERPLKVLDKNKDITETPYTIEEKIKIKYNDVIDGVVNFFEDGLNSEDLKSINTDLKKSKDKRSLNPVLERIQQKKRVSKNYKVDFNNFDEYFANDTLVKSKRYEDICKICNIYERNHEETKFDQEENFSDEEKSNNACILASKNEEPADLTNFNREYDLVSEYLDGLLTKIRRKDHYVDQEEPNEEFDFNFSFSPEKKETCIQKNKEKFLTKRRFIQILKKKNKEIFLQNIPKLLKTTKFSRKELHSIYILYKALQEITSQRYEKYNLNDGMDYYTFRNGIYQMFVQSEELAKRIFETIDINYSGFLNWEEFLNLMVIIRAKTLKEKIDLFIKIADEDGNGSLSKEEIFNLCKICLSKFIKPDDDNPNSFLNELCEYFTKLIFSAVSIDIEDEIPLETIRLAILSGNEESDLLAMFCGADM